MLGYRAREQLLAIRMLVDKLSQRNQTDVRPPGATSGVRQRFIRCTGLAVSRNNPLYPGYTRVHGFAAKKCNLDQGWIFALGL